MNAFRRLTDLKWVTVILSPLTIVLMEAFCFYPWLIWAGKWPELSPQRPPLGLFSLVLLPIASYFITKFSINRKTLPLALVQAIVIASGVMAIFIALRIEYSAGFALLDSQWLGYIARQLLDSFSNPHPEVFAPLVGVFLWWRGIVWGRSRLYFEDIYRSFLIGLAALAGVIVLWGISSGADSLKNLASTIGLYATGFFFFGLAALAIANLRAIQERIKEGAAVFSRRWVILIGVITGGIVLVGFGIATAFSRELIGPLSKLLNLAADLFLKALYYLLLPIGYIVQLLYYIWQWIVSLIQHGQPPPSFGQTGIPKPETLPEIAQRTLSPQAILALKWTIFALVAAAVVLLLARAIFRYWSAATKDDVDETHESLWSWEGLLADLNLFLKTIRQRFIRKSKKPSLVSAIPDWYKSEHAEERLGIREIYRRFLWESAHLGLARLRQETPFEYSRRMGQAIAGSGEQFDNLTNLYIDVRYGDFEAEDKQVDYANNLWRTLKALLRKPAG